MDETPQLGINDRQAQPTAAPADEALTLKAPCALPTPPARPPSAIPPHPPHSDVSRAPADNEDDTDNEDEETDEAIDLSGSGSLSEILASMSSEAQTLDARFQTGESARRKEPAGAAKSKLLNPTPYPDILLHSLPRQDALRFKWHLGRGLPAVFTPPEKEEDAAAHLCSDPAEAAPAKPGFLRLFGLLPSGEPWEKRINFADFPREGEGIFIGRDPSICRIVIPEESVSRCHAKLELAPKGLVITDQGSRNGVYVNGQQLAIYERQTPINDGDTLSLGDTSLCVEINT